MARFYRSCLYTLLSLAFSFLPLSMAGTAGPEGAWAAAPAKKPAPKKAPATRPAAQGSAAEQLDLASIKKNLPDFSLYRTGSGDGPTLLVIGGIQGDEPGGFSAASLLVTNYAITKGQVWVVPNLNFPSIVSRHRGLSGDMNRKFAAMDRNDPDFAVVRRIQEIILNPQVDLILNLHDGSGFYSPQRESATRNPDRWGQCVIIDQEDVSTPRYGHLAATANTAVRDANKQLVKPEHRYHLKNTETRKGDTDMEKTLSYFAVRNGKAAFGVEASKDFTTEFRSYYHILVLESFMRQLGIEFSRKFTLSPQGVQAAINDGVAVALYDQRLVLPLDNARPSQGYVPMRKNADLSPTFSKPLLAVLEDNAGWRVAYGNRTLTRLVPQYMEFDDTLPPQVEVLKDGKKTTVRVGEVLSVKDSFQITTIPGYRFNAIGATKENANGSECDVPLKQKDFIPRYSVDKAGAIYRVELYRGNAFAGMFLVRFGKEAPAARDTMTAIKGPESEFGL